MSGNHGLSTVATKSAAGGGPGVLDASGADAEGVALGEAGSAIGVGVAERLGSGELVVYGVGEVLHAATNATAAKSAAPGRPRLAITSGSASPRRRGRRALPDGVRSAGRTARPSRASPRRRASGRGSASWPAGRRGSRRAAGDPTSGA